MGIQNINATKNKSTKWLANTYRLCDLLFLFPVVSLCYNKDIKTLFLQRRAKPIQIE